MLLKVFTDFSVSYACGDAMFAVGQVRVCTIQLLALTARESRAARDLNFLSSFFTRHSLTRRTENLVAVAHAFHRQCENISARHFDSGISRLRTQVYPLSALSRRLSSRRGH